jgi:hypothetical protein
MIQSLTGKPETDNADRVSEIASAIDRPLPPDDSAHGMTNEDEKDLTPIPPRRSRPARCRLYPICNNRPCRLLSHFYYAGQRRSDSSMRDSLTARAADRETLAKRLNSPLARVGNPDTDPFVRYPFELSAEMQELVHLGQSPL